VKLKLRILYETEGVGKVGERRRPLIAADNSAEGSRPVAGDPCLHPFPIVRRCPQSREGSFMGYQTDFYGTLQFTRKLTPEELSTLNAIISAARHSDDCEVPEALQRQAEAARVIERDGNGPLVFDPHEGANLREAFRI
jgi:hypothetical protein